MTDANFVASHRGSVAAAGNQIAAPESAAKAGAIQTANTMKRGTRDNPMLQLFFEHRFLSALLLINGASIAAIVISIAAIVITPKVK
jgi:hypothetical protein